MTDSDWRSRRWDATHQRIYDAAMGLFAELGFERVNVGQIAGGAGVSVPTFYAHYPSKEHIVMQLPTTEQMAALLSTQPADIPSGSGSWASRRSGSRSGPRGARGHAGALADHRLDPAAAHAGRGVRAHDAEMIAAALSAERSAPLPQGDVILVNAYMAAFTSALLAWADSSGERKIEELMDEAFGALQGL